MNLRMIPQRLAACLILIACSSSPTNVSPPPPPGPPPPPPPPTAQHLYVGQDEIPGSIRVYDLPLTASSAPVVTVPMNAPAVLAVNSTTLVVTRITDYSISFLALPLTSASVPYATIVWGAGRGAATPLFLPSARSISAAAIPSMSTRRRSPAPRFPAARFRRQISLPIISRSARTGRSMGCSAT